MLQDRDGSGEPGRQHEQDTEVAAGTSSSLFSFCDALIRLTCLTSLPFSCVLHTYKAYAKAGRKALGAALVLCTSLVHLTLDDQDHFASPCYIVKNFAQMCSDVLSYPPAASNILPRLDTTGRCL